MWDSGLRSSKVIPSTLVVLTGFLVILISGGAKSAGAKLSVSYPDSTLIYSFELETVDVGLARGSGGNFGIGLASGEEWDLSWANIDFKPFVAGNASVLDGFDLSGITGGVEANYFDYRIGGWALSVDSRIWLDSAGFRLASRGSYSLGNLNLGYEAQFETGTGKIDRWYPPGEANYWKSLLTGIPSYIGNLDGNYAVLTGERKFTLTGKDFRWSQGFHLDSFRGEVILGLLGKVTYRESTFSLLIEELTLTRWKLNLTGEDMSIGFIKSPGRRDGYGLSLSYRRDKRFDIEILGAQNDPATTVKLKIWW
ncbi:hypothetical protein K9M06_00300 [Candidatus Bipolaricaulota bacterium]|nr:hypothetical protein [Candidatus Bipolaricaulota bacterium]